MGTQLSDVRWGACAMCGDEGWWADMIDELVHGKNAVSRGLRGLSVVGEQSRFLRGR